MSSGWTGDFFVGGRERVCRIQWKITVDHAVLITESPGSDWARNLKSLSHFLHHFCKLIHKSLHFVQNLSFSHKKGEDGVYEPLFPDFLNISP